MEVNDAIIAFDALSQETRLRVFRLLAQEGAQGRPAGTISEKLGIPANTLSFHLSHMSNAGLVLSRREGRSIIYMANLAHFAALMRFMAMDCCSPDAASVRMDKKRGCCVIEIADCCVGEEPKKGG